MIAKQLQQLLSRPDERLEILPWWVGPRTIERVNAVRAQAAASVYALSPEGRVIAASLRRIGFAGAASSRGSGEF